MTDTTSTMEPSASPPMTTPDPARVLELLTFRCGGQAYAVDIMSVREIRCWSEPTPLPHAPSYMRGMVNLRGSVLPVMDLAQRLGRDATTDDPRNVIIVMQKGSRVNGLLVEAVSDIVCPSGEELQAVPKVGAEDAESIADRLFLLEDEMIQVLSTERLMPALRSGDTELCA